MSKSSEELATALKLHQSGDLPTAERMYRQILETDPQNASAHHLLGLVELNRGRNGEAVSYISRAVELNSSDAMFLNNLGVAYAALKQFDQAAASFWRAVEINSGFPDAHYNMGNALVSLNKPAEAVACYQQAVRLRAYYVEAHYNLGHALRDLGKLDDAIASYERALSMRPGFSKARNSLAQALQRRGDQLGNQARYAEAATCYQRSIELRPNSAVAHTQFGLALAGQGKHDEAVLCYRHAVSIRPDFAEAHINLGVSLQARGDINDAVASYQQALKIRPESAQAHSNLGSALCDQGQHAEALASYAEALRLDPDFLEGYVNQAKALCELGRYDEAVHSCQGALRIQLDNAAAHYLLGTTLHYQEKLKEAQTSYAEALRIDPNYAEAHYNQALIWLAMGDFERGWLEYDWRWKCKGFATGELSRPRWDGSPLEGRTVLIVAEQGVGDTLQFIRYAALVKQRGCTVIVQCPKALVHILGGCPGIDRLIAQGDPLPEFDVYAPLMSLPGIFRTTPETAPADVPYLLPDERLVERWREVLDEMDGFKVGVAWRGHPDYKFDRARSFPLAELEPMVGLPGVRLISLQKIHGTKEVAEVADRFTVAELGPDFDEASGAFMDTAAVMKCLDLVVCCDTSIAHLGGAMGVPVWLALPYSPDWRWLRGRKDSPWYPTHRLFQQPRPGDWEAVFAQMRTELQNKLRTEPRAQRATSIEIGISPGELIDKITILEIKSERIEDAQRLRNVRTTLDQLKASRDQAIEPSEELTALTAELKGVNERLWDIENEIRDRDRAKDFGRKFVELARSVYCNNDKRATLKRQIDELLGSKILEEKSYTPYQ